MPAVPNKTLSLINTVKYLVETKDVVNALLTIDSSIELLSCYVEIPDELTAAITDPNLFYILCKMSVIRQNKPKIVEFAIRVLEKDANLLVEETFFNTVIKFALMESLTVTNNKLIRNYLIDIINHQQISISMLGYLLDIKEYDLLKSKLLTFITNNPITYNLVDFISILSKSAPKVLEGISVSQAVYNLHFTNDFDNNKLRLLNILINAYPRQKLEILGKMSNIFQLYASFYMRQNFPDAIKTGIEELPAEIQQVINGMVNTKLVNFMVSNNKTEFKLLEGMSKTGCPNFGFCHSLMNAHTTNDSFYRTNRYNKSQEWNRFLEMGGLGLVHTCDPFEIMGEILPASADTGEPSALLSLGIIGYNSVHLYGGDDAYLKEIEAYILSILTADASSIPEDVLFASYLSLGLVNYGVGDYDLYNKIKILFEKPSTVSQETAAYSIGLLFAGTNDLTVIECLKSVRATTDFKRLVRVINLALSFIQSDSQNITLSTDGVEFLEEQLTTLGIKYCNTGDLKVIEYLLSFVNTGNDDMKRCAVIALSMVVGYDSRLIEEILLPLATSHSMYVRAAVTFAIGFFGVETLDLNLKARMINLLEALLFDSEDLVKQQASFGLGILLQQFNPREFAKDPADIPEEEVEINKIISPLSEVQPEIIDMSRTHTVNYRRISKLFNSRLSDRSSSKCSKIGASFGRSMMEMGGRSAVFTLRNISGEIDTVRVKAFWLFAHSWYWNPLYNFVSLLVLPTPILQLNTSLELHPGTGETQNIEELIVVLEDVKKIRKFKKKLVDEAKDVERVLEGEIPNNGKMNYSSMLRSGRFNRIDFI